MSALISSHCDHNQHGICDYDDCECQCHVRDRRVAESLKRIENIAAALKPIKEMLVGLDVHVRLLVERSLKPGEAFLPHGWTNNKPDKATFVSNACVRCGNCQEELYVVANHLFHPHGACANSGKRFERPTMELKELR